MADENATPPAQATTEAAKGADTPATPAPESKAPDTAKKTPAPEQKAADTPPAEAAKPAAPEKYELKLPEKTLLDASTVERVSAYAKEKGLSNEAAQELLDREHQAVAAHHEAQMKQVEGIRKEWAETASKDPEIGGNEFKANAELASRLIEKVNPALKPLLNETGFGNHPEVIRFVVRFMKMAGVGEDQFVNPQSQDSSKKPIEDKFYGTPN